jgi:hypothetical protein
MELGLRVSAGHARTHNLGLQTRTVTTDDGSLCTRMKSWLRFWNWKGRFVIHLLTEQIAEQ